MINMKANPKAFGKTLGSSVEASDRLCARAGGGEVFNLRLSLPRPGHVRAFVLAVVFLPPLLLLALVFPVVFAGVGEQLLFVVLGPSLVILKVAVWAFAVSFFLKLSKFFPVLLPIPSSAFVSFLPLFFSHLDQKMNGYGSL